MDYIFRFKVKYYNSVNKNYEEVGGLGFAPSFTAAMEKIEEFFGDDLVSVQRLDFYDKENLIFLPEENLDIFSAAEFPFIDFSVKSSNQK